MWGEKEGGFDDEMRFFLGMYVLSVRISVSSTFISPKCKIPRMSVALLQIHFFVFALFSF